MLETSKNVVWQSADGRVTSDHCRVTVQSTFFKNFSLLETSQKTLCLTVGRRSRDLNHCRVTFSTFFKKSFPNRLKRPCKTLFDSRPTVAWPPTTVAWPFSDFFQNFPNCLKRPKNVVWQSADGRVTSDHCRVTVQRLFSKFSNCLKRPKTLFDSRPTVAWPQPLSRDRSATFFKIFPNRLKRPKTLFDSRPTVAWPQPLSRDRSATFFKIFPNRLKRPKTLFDSRPTVAWPPTTVAWPFSDFFQNFLKLLETSKNVVWQSADGRVTSDHCRVTVQRLFSKNFLIAWNVQKTLFDSRPTVAWPQPLSRDRSATFFKIFPNRLKRPKNVVWQSADGRVISDHCRVTVQRHFSKFSQIAWNV